MTFEVFFVVLTSAAAVGILVHRLGRRIWSHVGALYILAAVVFHAVSEVVTFLAPDRNSYRTMVTQDAINNWVIWVGPAILLMTAVYVIVLGRVRTSGAVVSMERTTRFFRWRYCFIATAPMYLVALAGRGFVPGSSEEGGYFSSGLTSQYLLLGISLTTFAYIAKNGHLLGAVLLQSFALALLGQRLAILAGLLLVGFLLSRHGWRFTRHQVRGAVILAILGSVILSSSRDSVGRDELQAGAGGIRRATALVSGASGLFQGETYTNLADDYVYRIDGNAFAATVLERQGEGFGYVGLAPIVNAGTLAVPSFINPSKLSSDDSKRSQKVLIGRKYNIPTDRIDFLPTGLGGSIAYQGAPGVLLFALTLGVLFAVLDRALKVITPFRTIIAMGGVLLALYYESGTDGIFVTMRGAILLAIALWAIGVVATASRRGLRLGYFRVKSTSIPSEPEHLSAIGGAAR